MSGSNPLTIARDPTVLVNPLAAMDAGVKSAGLVYDLRQQQATEAAGQAYQGAINQQTGEFDPNEFRRRLAASGPAAMAAGHELANTQQISSDQLKQNLEKAKWVNATSGALLLQGDYSDAAMLGALHSGVAGGILTLPEAQRQLATMPPDAAGRKRWLEEHRDTSGSYAEQVQQQYGTAGTEVSPTGARVGTVQQSPRAGGGLSAQPQAGVSLGMDPAQLAERQRWLQSPRDYPDPANANITKHGTNETYLRDTGVPDKFIYPGGAPASPGTTASPLGTGRPPPALLNPNKPQATPSSAPAPSPAGTGISGPTPAQAATAEATRRQGEIGPGQFQKEAEADTLAQNQQAILGNMLVDTSQFTTGPLTGIVGKVRNLAGNLGLNINAEAQSAKESFNKLAAGIAVSQAQAVGAGSDTRFNVVSAANPHEELSPAGVDLILRQLQGNTDYIRARASLAAKYSDKANYPAFQESIKELDPRVFQMARMTGDQRQTYWKSLDTEARRQLDAAGNKAKDMGVLGGG